MRPGKQLFPLNYNNIISDNNIKYNIEAIKLIIRETYGGNRTYINQIMFYEQSAEEVKDIICSNDLNKIYKLNNKCNSKKNLRLNKKGINRNDYYSEQIIKQNKTQMIKNNNETFEEKQEESDIYKISDNFNGNQNINNERLNEFNKNKKITSNNKKQLNNSKNNKTKKIIEITPITKSPKRQIKTDFKNNSKNKTKEKLEIKFNENKDDNLTPNKYLQRIKNLNKGNKTTSANSNIHFQKNYGFNLKNNNNSNLKKNLENNLFNTSLNNNSGNINMNEKEKMMIEQYEEDGNDFEEEIPEEQNQDLNSFQQRENKNIYNQYINGQNNYNKQNSEYMEDDISNISERKKQMSKTHENLHYHQRINNNLNFNNLQYIKSNNNSSILKEEKNYNDINYNHNNYSQRRSLISRSENYNTIGRNKTNHIKQKLDYLEGNILEIKNTLKEISEGFAFCVSQEFIIKNFRDEIISICEEVYNEYYQNISKNNINLIDEKNENDYLMTNSNYISQNDNENKIIEKELDKQINKQLDEKLGKLQNNIFDKYLKPTINKIGDSMKKNIEQIELEVNNIDQHNIIESSKDNNNIDLSNKLSTSKIRNEKFDEINRIGDRLYNKLLEKEKKLKLLKQEKAKYLDNEEE